MFPAQTLIPKHVDNQSQDIRSVLIHIVFNLTAHFQAVSVLTQILELQNSISAEIVVPKESLVIFHSSQYTLGPKVECLILGPLLERPDSVEVAVPPPQSGDHSLKGN